MSHAVMINQRTEHFNFFCKPVELGQASSKIDHDFPKKGVLKLESPKNILTKNVLLNLSQRSPELLSNGKIQMIF